MSETLTEYVDRFMKECRLDIHPPANCPIEKIWLYRAACSEANLSLYGELLDWFHNNPTPREEVE